MKGCAIFHYGKFQISAGVMHYDELQTQLNMALFSLWPGGLTDISPISYNKSLKQHPNHTISCSNFIEKIMLKITMKKNDGYKMI